MAWAAHLALQYQRDGELTSGHFLHQGPLRVLKSHHPEGPSVLHQVLVHPPGGLVGGDSLDIDIDLGPGAHALITTPGAARFYRCEPGLSARQTVSARLQAGARLEWLPLETIAYPGCQALNHIEWQLAPGAEALAWEVLALGLPAAGQPFDHGRWTQHSHWPGVWLDRGVVDGSDTRLLNSPLGFAGQPVLGQLVHLSGSPLDAEAQTRLLDGARGALEAVGPGVQAGATSPHPQVRVLRVLGPGTEPVRRLLQAVWAVWREAAWGLKPVPSRLWGL